MKGGEDVFIPKIGKQLQKEKRMHGSGPVSREAEITATLEKLKPSERDELEFVAQSHSEGGSKVKEPLRARAVKLGLAYTSGRLRPVAYKLLRGDEALLVG